ncbi:MAG: CPBP family intramembrane metalloprotease [Anaerolineales bacterium]|nr:CPBP family intramembrane metalloprotease [Anaerolineales bacterium]
MNTKFNYKPAVFFMITFLITFTTWFAAAYFSYQPGMEGAQLLCMIPGLFAPLIAVIIMMSGAKNRELRKDFQDRLSLKLIRPKYFALILLVMPVTLLLATALSLLFGQPIRQFLLNEEFAIMEGEFYISLLIMFLAPTLEELGWRGYGVDSLRSKFNLFQTTMVFALLWGLWHVPLFFIHGYYQNELWNTNIVYAGNFFVQLLAAAILMNWVYYRNNRSITAAILFHFSMNLFSELLQTEQFTKCIIGILLLLLAAWIIVADRKFFFNNPEGTAAS